MSSVFDVEPAQLPPEALPQYISLLETAIGVLERNDPTEMKNVMGLSAERVPEAGQREFYRKQFLDKAHWNCTLGKRYSGNRIAEAIPNCRYVIANSTAQGDYLPHLFLGVAIYKSGGDLQLAKSEIEMALNSMNEGVNNALWGRAHYSRLLAKLGEDQAAAEQVHQLRQWYTWHKLAMPPSKFAGLMSDAGEGDTTIVDGIPDFGAGMYEMGPNMMVMF